MPPALANWTAIVELVLLLLGFGVFVAGACWSLFSDRAKGRRRCPRCWHDLSGTPGRRCGECGHEARDEADLHRTRRRTALAVASILGGVGIGLYAIDRVSQEGVLGYLPTRVVIAALPFDGRGDVAIEIDRRARAGGFTEDHWRALARRAVRGEAAMRPPSEGWIEKYGGLADRALAQLMRTGDATRRAEAEAEALRLACLVTPTITIAAPPVHADGAAPVLDALVTERWRGHAQTRLLVAPRVAGAAPRRWERRRADIQRRSFPVPLPALPAGVHEIEIAVDLARRVRDDAPWTDAGSVVVPVVVEIAPGAGPEPISAPELDAVIARVFRAGLVRYRTGSLPIRISLDHTASFIAAFDDVAVGVAVEVRRDGVLARRLDAWWLAGSATGGTDRGNAWEVPWLDDAVLGAPPREGERWSIHVVGRRDLAARVRGASRWWSGEVVLEDVPVRRIEATAPSRGWIEPEAPDVRE